MTPRDRAEASRTAQGLPPTVKDAAVLARVASILERAEAGEAA